MGKDNNRSSDDDDDDDNDDDDDDDDEDDEDDDEDDDNEGFTKEQKYYRIYRFRIIYQYNINNTILILINSPQLRIDLLYIKI